MMLSEHSKDIMRAGGCFYAPETTGDRQPPPSESASHKLLKQSWKEES